MASFFGKPDQPLYGQPISHAETMSLHTLMEIKEAIGELKSNIKTTNEKISGLDADIKGVRSDVIDIKSTISFAKGVKWAVITIVSLAIAGMTFYLTSTFYLKKIDELNDKNRQVQQSIIETKE